jgi:hypothetical protein
MPRIEAKSERAEQLPMPHSSFTTSFLRYFRTQMVTYAYTLTSSVRKYLELKQYLNVLNS